MSREQAETTLRQDIEYAWEPWLDKDTISQSKFSRVIRNALAPNLIGQYKEAALVLLRKFIKEDDIDEDELDELADSAMTKHSAWIAGMVTETTTKWIEDDENPGRAFSRERAELIAITEITRARTMGEMAAAELLAEVDVILVGTWITMEDELVCFPAGTFISTPNGDVPIERLVTGDLVLTRLGPRKIKATTKRNYTGRMVEITAGSKKVVSTENHRYWTLEKDWLTGRNVQAGHHLYSVENQYIEVDSVVNFRLCKSQHVIPAISQKLGFPSIPINVLMPISPVNFNGNHHRLDSKVYGISSAFNLLSEVNAKIGQSDSYVSLYRGFAVASSVARKAAKLPVGISRLFAKLFSAGFAINKMNRTATKLRTVMTSISPFRGLEVFTASLARLNQNVGMPTFDAAHVKSVRNAGIHSEYVSTSCAGFVGLLGASNEQRSTSSATALIRGLSIARRSNIERLFALLADFVDSVAFPFWSSKFHLMKIDWHVSPIRPKELPTIVVYDIQVEDQPEFFANGILVHNCEICGPLHLTPESYWSEFFPNGSPAHPRCRCMIDWKEKAKRPSKRTKQVGRMGKRSRPKKVFSRMRRRSAEEVEGFQVIIGTPLVEGGVGSGITGHRTYRASAAPRTLAPRSAAKKAHELTRKEYADKEVAKHIKKTTKEYGERVADLNNQLKLAREGNLPPNEMQNFIDRDLDPVKVYKEMLSDEKQMFDRKMMLWGRPESSLWMSFTDKHESIVEKAIKQGKYVPDEVLSRYLHSLWMPEAVKTRIRLDEERKQYVEYAESDKKQQWFKDSASSVRGKMEAAKERLDKLHSDARAAIVKESETRGDAGYGRKESELKALKESLVADSLKWERGKATMTEDQQTEVLTSLFAKQAEYAQKTQDFRDIQRAYNQKVWEAIAPKPEDRISLVEYKVDPNFVGEINTSGHHAVKEMVEKITAKSAFPDGIVYKVRNIVSGESGQVSQDGRAHAIGLGMHVPSNVNAETIAHELGHIMDYANGERIGELSVGYLAKRTENFPVSHLGSAYDTTEVATEDNFKNKYIGKHYNRASSEILSMGVQYLFEDATKFSSDDPDHFKYTVGVLTGVIQ